MSKQVPRRIVSMSVLPGEKTDGTGRMCIHLFVQNEDQSLSPNSYIEPHVLHPGEDRQLVARPTRGKLACGATPPRAQQGNVIKIVQRTDDPRAVTCPHCEASEIFKLMMAKLEGV